VTNAPAEYAGASIVSISLGRLDRVAAGRPAVSSTSGTCGGSPALMPGDFDGPNLQPNTASQTQGDRHGQRRAERQSGGQETQKGKNQDHRRSAKPEGRKLAAVFRDRQKEIAAKRLALSDAVLGASLDRIARQRVAACVCASLQWTRRIKAVKSEPVPSCLRAWSR
jgi:hypothetical protein